MTNPRPELAKLYAELAASRRDTPPPADETGRWVQVVDQDTGKPCWFPKALGDEWQARRWPRTSVGEDTP